VKAILHHFSSAAAPGVESPGEAERRVHAQNLSNKNADFLPLIVADGDRDKPDSGELSFSAQQLRNVFQKPVLKIYRPKRPCNRRPSRSTPAADVSIKTTMPARKENK